MVDVRRDDDRAFEDEVRRIAGLLYPDVHGGATVEGGRERDGIYVTDDAVVIIEATRSASQEKAQKDGAKLKSLAQEKARQFPYHAVKAFFVTERDPTGHQLDVIRRLGAPLAAVSFQGFRNRLIDVSGYLSCSGPLGFEDLTAVFRELQGYQPDPGALLILQRLPGLQVEDSQNNTRSFMDDDLVDAARAGDLVKWVVNPDAQRASLFSGWATSLGEVGLEVFRSRCESWRVSGESLQVAMSQLNRVDDVDSAKGDLTRALLAIDLAPLGSTPIANTVIPKLVLSDVADCSSMTFSDCIFDFVDLSGCQSDHLPFFNSCIVDQMDGANSLRGLDRFSNCEVREFLDSTLTLAAIRDLKLSDDAQVSLAILKKVYVQAGSARKEGALYRGMPVHLRGRVAGVLKSLVSMDILTKSRRGNQTLYAPLRAESVRVRRLLDAPAANREDPLLNSFSS